MILEVLQTILVLLTGLVHPDHGLDLRRPKTNPSVLDISRYLMLVVYRLLELHEKRYLDSLVSVVFQILLTVLELLLLFVTFPVSLEEKKKE